MPCYQGANHWVHTDLYNFWRIRNIYEENILSCVCLTNRSTIPNKYPSPSVFCSFCLRVFRLHLCCAGCLRISTSYFRSDSGCVCHCSLVHPDPHSRPLHLKCRLAAIRPCLCIWGFSNSPMTTLVCSFQRKSHISLIQLKAPDGPNHAN